MFFDEQLFNPEGQAEAFNRLLARDGYRLVIEYRVGWMQGDRHVEADPYFEIQPVSPAAIMPESLAATSHNAVNEQISKANRRIATGDFAGAITSSYTLWSAVTLLALLAIWTHHRKRQARRRQWAAEEAALWGEDRDPTETS